MAGRDVVRRFSRWLTILAILNLYVAPMPPLKFWLNRTYGLGGDIVWRISRWRPSWISERKDFSDSESLCHCDASHQVLAQSHSRFGRRCQNRTTLAILNLYVDAMPPIMFWLNPTYSLGGDVICSITRWPPAILEIGTERF